MTDTRVAQVARLSVPVITGVALSLTLREGSAIVNLLLGYALVTQLFPSMIMSLSRDNPVGVVALILNIVVCVVVSLLTQSSRADARQAEVPAPVPV